MGTTILGATALYTMSGNISGGYHPDKNIKRDTTISRNG